MGVCSSALSAKSGKDEALYKCRLLLIEDPALELGPGSMWWSPTGAPPFSGQSVESVPRPILVLAPSLPFLETFGEKACASAVEGRGDVPSRHVVRGPRRPAQRPPPPPPPPPGGFRPTVSWGGGSWHQEPRSPPPPTARNRFGNLLQPPV